MLATVLDEIVVPRIGQGRARTRPDALIADRAYTSGVTRRMLRDRKITAIIPQKRDEIAARHRRGSARWPLTYHAAHRMFERVNADVGTSATLHALRHTAAYRMAQDPAMPLTDVQYVLGHAQLTTTQIYLTPRKEDVIERVLAHHAEQTRKAAQQAPPPAAGYRPETLDVLFGRRNS